MPSDNDVKNIYGGFLATQDADSRTELELEQTLLFTTGRIYQEPDLELAKLSVIGALETTKNFLVKYKDALPADADVLREIDFAVEILRSSSLDREGINLLYQPLREDILYILGKQLGFRKKKIQNYKWTELMQTKMQIPKTEKTKQILESKKKPRGSAASVNSSTTQFMNPTGTP